MASERKTHSFECDTCGKKADGSVLTVVRDGRSECFYALPAGWLMELSYAEIMSYACSDRCADVGHIEGNRGLG